MLFWNFETKQLKCIAGKLLKLNIRCNFFGEFGMHKDEEGQAGGSGSSQEDNDKGQRRKVVYCMHCLTCNPASLLADSHRKSQ